MISLITIRNVKGDKNKNMAFFSIKIAIKNAFDKRNTKADIIEVQIEKIKNSKELSERWQNYRNSKSYARNIKFEDTLKALEKIKNIYNS